MAMEPAPLVKPVTVPEETIKVEEPQPEPVKEEMIETKEVIEEEPMPPQEEEPKSNAPVSWAAMLAGKSAGGPPPVVKQTPPPQMPKPVEPKPHSMSGDANPQPQRAPR